MGRKEEIEKLQTLRKKYPDPNELYEHLSPEQQELLWELVAKEAEALKISEEKKAEYEEKYRSEYKNPKERAADNIDDLLAVGYKPIQLYKDLSNQLHDPIVGPTNRLKINVLLERFPNLRDLESSSSTSTTSTTSKSEPEQKTHQPADDFDEAFELIPKLRESGYSDETIMNMGPSYKTAMKFINNTNGGNAKRSKKGGSKPKKTSKKKSKKNSKKKSKKKSKKPSRKK